MLHKSRLIVCILPTLFLFGCQQTWWRVPHDEAVFGGPGLQTPSAVAVGGPGLVAVGHEARAVVGSSPGAAGYDFDAAVWTASDYDTWSRVSHDEAVFGGPGTQWMADVVAAGPGLVAVGRDRDSAAVWTSADGSSWNRVPHDEAVFGGSGGQQMKAIVLAEFGLIAVGTDGDSAAVWTSADGSSWNRVPHDEEILGGPGFQTMNGITRYLKSGLLVSVGSDGRKAAVWASRDGVGWQRVDNGWAPLYGGAGAVEMRAVASSSTLVIAVGIEFDATSPTKATVKIWASFDGFNWYLPSEGGGWGMPTEEIRDVLGRDGMNLANAAAFTGGEHHIVVIGHGQSARSNFPPTFDARVWWNDDDYALSWSRDGSLALYGSGLETLIMRDVVMFGSRAIAVGTYEGSGSSSAAVWYSKALH